MLVMIAATVLLIATGGTLMTHLSSRNLIRTAQETDAGAVAISFTADHVGGRQKRVLFESLDPEALAERVRAALEA